MIALGALLFRDANRTLVAVSMGPETVNQKGNSRCRIMCENKPVADDTLQEDIMDSENDGLGVDADFEG